MPCRWSAKSPANPPADSPAGMPLSLAVQVSPPSSERSARLRSSGDEERRVADGRQAVAARREAVLVVGGRHSLVGQHLPAASGVGGREDAQLAVDRVAHRETALAAGVERHAVVERRLVGVAERLGPGRAAVGAAVDAGVLAGPDREHVRDLAVDLDVAERQALGAGRGDVFPCLARVGGAEDLGLAPGQALAADPRLRPAHGGEPAEVLVGVEHALLPVARERLGGRLARRAGRRGIGGGAEGRNGQSEGGQGHESESSHRPTVA